MADKPLMVLWTDGAPVYVEALAAAGLDDRLRLEGVDRADTPSAAQKAEAEMMLAWGAPAGLLAEMPKLRWVQTTTAGVESWLGRPDLSDALLLSAAKGVHRVQMPENILAALFHATKPIAAAAIDQQTATWTRRVAVPLAGKTLGILGLGTIGAELARKARALELRVVGVRRSPGSVEHVDAVYGPQETDRMLGEADFVLNLLPVTPDTRDFMNADRFAAMRPGAWFLNFGRGATVVDADLIAAVTGGVIAGAVLDVFRTEPLPRDDPFWTTPGISVWPHVGGLHPDRDAIVADLVVENTARFLDGRPLLHQVDRARGY
ncbi:MAG: D-2-hydroxyacid dehydrogenase [Thalassobaculaceae bacterium]|nr:D-2-hydroxyacid dehydrogenase [Thalassobaculaceae bacterium]